MMEETLNIKLVYITAGSKEEAGLIGRELLKARLAACVNIIENMNSMYWWQGEIQEDQEVILIAKTIASKVENLIEKVKEIHSYDCPCVVSLGVQDGNREFLDWIRDEVKD
jgi:periplasmic divalent cation tolerance protein